MNEDLKKMSGSPYSKMKIKDESPQFSSQRRSLLALASEKQLDEVVD